MTTGAITSRLMITLMLAAMTVSGVAGQDEDVVLDDVGNQVVFNAEYYAEPYLDYEEGAWLSRHRLSIRTYEACPEGPVVSGNVNVLPRVEVQFSSRDAEPGSAVRVSTKLNIVTAPSVQCPGSGYWSVEEGLVRNINLNGGSVGDDSIFSIGKGLGPSYNFYFGGTPEPDNSNKLAVVTDALAIRHLKVINGSLTQQVISRPISFVLRRV